MYTTCSSVFYFLLSTKRHIRLKLLIPGLKLSFEIGLLMALQIRGESDIKSFSQTYSTAEFTNSQMALNHLVVQPYRGSCWGWRACFWRRGTASISDGGGKGEEEERVGELSDGVSWQYSVMSTQTQSQWGVRFKRPFVSSVATEKQPITCRKSHVQYW